MELDLKERMLEIALREHFAGLGRCNVRETVLRRAFPQKRRWPIGFAAAAASLLVIAGAFGLARRVATEPGGRAQTGPTNPTVAGSTNPTAAGPQKISMRFSVPPPLHGMRAIKNRTEARVLKAAEKAGRGRVLVQLSVGSTDGIAPGLEFHIFAKADVENKQELIMPRWIVAVEQVADATCTARVEFVPDFIEEFEKRTDFPQEGDLAICLWELKS